MNPANEAIDVPATPAPDPAPAGLVPLAGGKPKSALIAYAEKGIALKSMEDAFIFAKAVIDSGMAPYGFATPQAVLVAIQFGAELGLPPMSALQNIAVINGRPALWGDAVPGVCNGTGLVENYSDEQIGEQGSDSWGWRVTIKRKGRADPIVRTFTIGDAKRAKLWEKRGTNGKDTPWITYPGRMIFMRARTFAFRDAFPDALRGIRTVEELHDHPPQEKNVTASLDAVDAKPEAA